MKFILGLKSATTQMYNDQGLRMPVTTLMTSPCYVVDFRTMDKDGYWAIVLGFGQAKKSGKSDMGKTKKAGIETPLRFLREVRINGEPTLSESGTLTIGEVEFTKGQEIKADIFTTDDMVNVTSVSKGKGFQGVVRRHGFAGGPKTHGQSDRHRAPGSIGQGTTPGRVYKGKRMAGRMGNETVTVQNLPVIEGSESMLKIKGLVPGSRGTLVIIQAK